MYDLVVLICLANAHPCPDAGPWKVRTIETRLELGECISRSQRAVVELSDVSKMFASRIATACRFSEVKSADDE